MGINEFLKTILEWIYGFVGNYGWSVVLFTLLIRFVLLPLDIKQRKSMRAMQRIQPADADQPPDPLRDVHRHEDGRQRASGAAGVRHHRFGQSGAGFVAVGQERVDAGLPLRGGLAES